MNLGLLVALENAHKVFREKGPIFNTGPYGDPPLKIKILKIGLRSDLSWAKVGLEPKYHEPGSFGGFGKCQQSCPISSGFLTLDHMGTPFKKQNFENRAS